MERERPAVVEVGPGVESLGKPADYLIGADLGALRGTTCSTAFARFGIPTNETATHSTGRPALKNVIARVTGGAASNIDGTLRSAMPLADVWLLNPAGSCSGRARRSRSRDRSRADGDLPRLRGAAMSAFREASSSRAALGGGAVGVRLFASDDCGGADRGEWQRAVGFGWQAARAGRRPT